MLGQELTLTFPNGDVHKLPLRPVADHRFKYFSFHEPKADWWRHEKPGVVAMWPRTKMTWAEVFPHLLPSPTNLKSCARSWESGTVDIKLYP